MKRSRYEIDMCSGPLLGKIILYFVPLMLTGVLQLLYTAVDIIVVGRFCGPDYLAAVGSTGSLVNLIVNFFTGLSIGASIVIAQLYGVGDVRGIHNAVHTSMLVSLTSGLIIGTFGFFASTWMLRLMGSPEDVLPLASQYLKLYFLGAPAMMLYDFGAAVLRASGDTRRPLYILLTSGLIHVGLNLLFVLSFGMNVDGVALATVISQILSAVLVLLCLIRSEGACKLFLRDLHIDTGSLKAILSNGLPAGIQGCVFSLSNVVIQSTVNSFGSIVIAGNAAAGNIEGFIYISMNSVYQAALTFTGQNYGAKKYKRIDRIWWLCSSTVLVVGLSLGLTALFFGRELLGIYSNDTEVIGAGIARCTTILPTYFLCGLMEVTCGMLRGTGHATVPAVVSVLGACVFRIVWICTIYRLFPTLHILYLSYPISWLLTVSVHFICFLFVRHRYRKKDPEAALAT